MELFVLPTVTSSCTDVPQVAHGVACAICYLLGLWPAPFLAWMGSVMLLNEASTVPLTVRRVMLECGWSKGALYDAVQLAFAGLFLGVRIGVALPVSVWWWPQMLQLLRSGEVHSYGVGVYFLVANLLLTGLNIFWAFLICKKATKRLARGADEEHSFPMSLLARRPPPPALKRRAARPHRDEPRDPNRSEVVIPLCMCIFTTDATGIHHITTRRRAARARRKNPTEPARPRTSCGDVRPRPPTVSGSSQRRAAAAQAAYCATATARRIAIECRLAATGAAAS